MKLVASLSLLLATGLCSLAPAQQTGLLNGAAGFTLQTVPFVVSLSSANVTPPLTGVTATGSGVIYLHVVKDITGQIVAGTVDFSANYSLPTGAVPTGFTLNSGAAGSNGGVVFNSGFTAPTNTTNANTGTINGLQYQIMPGDATGIASLQNILNNPGNYYANLSTADNRGGVLRAQLQRASTSVFLAPLALSQGATAPTGSTPAGLAAVTALYTTDANNNVTGGVINMNLSVNGFPNGGSITGLTLTNGAPGAANSTTAFDSGLTATSPLTVSSTGTATGQFSAPATSTTDVATLANLLNNPGNFYYNVSTADATGGLANGKLVAADQATFSMVLSPGNETPPVTDLLANAPGNYTLYSLRKPDGTAASGLAIFDYFPIYPTAATITGLHMHTAPIGVAGPVVIDSGISPANPVKIPAGGWDIYRYALVTSATGVANLNSVLVNPENHYINMHDVQHPAGAMRSQVAQINNAPPTVVFLSNGAGNNQLQTFSPGDRIYLYGTNLAKVNSDLTGLGFTTFPTILSGTQVQLGGVNLPVLAASNGIVIVQVPANFTPGQYQLALYNGNGTSIIPNVLITPKATATTGGSTGSSTTP